MAVREMRIDEGAIAALELAFRGELFEPEDPGYDEARAIWNAAIDKRPGLIAQCSGVADVIAAVNFAREHNLLVSVRGGGHNIAGTALCDDGVVIDLSQMKAIRVDPEAKTARVEAGATLADFDHEAQAFGLATPLGINSTTGVAGLTLGGGFGWLSRKYGMTIDNLQSVDIVTSAGTLLHVSETEHPDLFWGIRGGSGNFGIVTSFEYDLHEVGPEIFGGPIVYDTADRTTVLQFVREFNQTAPDELSTWVVLRKAPPLPFLAEEDVGKDVLIVIPFYAGDPAEGEKLVAPLREIATPLGDGVGPVPYEAFQQLVDPLLEPGLRNYWKSHNFADMTDEVIDIAIQYADNLPSPMSEIFFGHVGGEMARVPAEATAYPHRDATYIMNVHTRWDDPALDDTCKAWAREYYDAQSPNAQEGVYVNFISEDSGEERLAYGANYERLSELKQAYDPHNLFRVNQNVKPTA
ncbi:MULTISPECIES: FAD-binding oxidoreductase [unclassified Haladaptatus]|uniref:FAD-binding oxidoreductase n=1 Tax=unclassified Haladaptatus TaxID=2622732 RepID=UPI0023E7B0C0|nr:MULTISPECIES: FAD-binding oxidoreductase [unclassified Haladaptatus]